MRVRSPLLTISSRVMTLVMLPKRLCVCVCVATTEHNTRSPEAHQDAPPRRVAQGFL